MREAPPSRLSGLDAARRKFGERADRLVPFYLRGDSAADDAASALDTMDRPARHRALDAAISGKGAAPEPVTDLVQRMRHVPFWVDRERCERGAQTFRRMGLLGGITLGFGALAGSYCSRAGNKPLVFTGRLTRDSYSRLVETGRFLLDVCQPGAAFPGAEGWKSIVHVRLMHAAIRGKLLRDESWRTADWGVPINQADMSGTVLLFSWIVVRGVRQLGGTVSDSDAEDLQHLWRYVGWLMGVDEELLCTSTAEAEALFQLLTTIDAGPDEDSRTLVAALFDKRIFEGRIPNARAANELRRFYQAISRSFIGDEAADAVALPRSGYDKVVKILPLVTGAVSKGLDALPFGDQLLLRAGDLYWNKFLTR